MRLKKAQKEKLLEWVAEGLRTDEINARAAEYDPPFAVSRKLVDYYRRTRAFEHKAILKEVERNALSTGLALREVRVEKLQRLAEMLEDDLINKGLTWTTDVKGFGQGKNFTRIEIERFNAEEIKEYRALLDQISSEVGDKKPDQVIPSEIIVTFGKPKDGKDT